MNNSVYCLKAKKCNLNMVRLVHYCLTIMFILRALSFGARRFDLPHDSNIRAQPEADGTNDTRGWQIKIQGSQMTTTSEKMNIVVIISG